MQSKIIHIDMDAFYAAVEQRDNPALRGKPVAIGREKARGVVATASYEARKYGVHSAMPSVTAKRKCPNLIFVKGRMEVYREISFQIREIFSRFTVLIEPLSLDEAYLDVTYCEEFGGSATLIAKEIKRLVKVETGLTASAGVSYNKFLAKIASDYQKPDGLFVITPAEANGFIQKLPVGKFFGIGKVTEEKMHRMGIFFGHDLKKLSLARLQKVFGKAGGYYYQIVRGTDHRKVNPHRERKSIGGENTFSKDLASLEELEGNYIPIIEKVFSRLKQSGKLGKTITIKVKFHNFETITRSKTLANPISTKDTLLNHTIELLKASYQPSWKVRLLGVSVSNFLSDEQEAIQLAIDFTS